MSRFIGLMLLLTGGAAGCSSAPKRASSAPLPPQPSAQTAPGPQGAAPEYGPPVPAEVYGPPASAENAAPAPAVAPAYGPEPILLRPLVLVLGPGLARGFAYVGALRALSEAKIPVAAVYGTEMGALIGTLYASHGSINHLEWALLKFKDDVFIGSNGILGDLLEKSNDGNRLESALKKVLDGQDLSRCKIPDRVGIQLRDSNVIQLAERGSAAEALRAAMATPGFLSPGRWDGKTAVSTVQSRPFLVHEAKAFGPNPVVVIDATSSGARDGTVAAATDLAEADLVIQPDLRGIGVLDFKKRTDAAFRGKSAVVKELAQLRHLVGLPAEAETPR